MLRITAVRKNETGRVLASSATLVSRAEDDLAWHLAKAVRKITNPTDFTAGDFVTVNIHQWKEPTP